jgi:hypothetical protein
LLKNFFIITEATMKTNHSKASGNQPVVTPAANRADSTVIQAKLRIGAVNDPLETEADQMADRVMRMPATPFVQRKCISCEEEDKQLQRNPLAVSMNPFIKEKVSGDGAVSEGLTQQIKASNGGGTEMDSATRSFMESRFGVDFSSVKIHSGNDAVKMCQELNAQAFTVDNSIYFNSSQYNPQSERGKHLLAHELTHTVQQGNGSKIQKANWRMVGEQTTYLAKKQESALASKASFKPTFKTPVIQRKPYDPTGDLLDNSLNNLELAEAIEKTEHFLQILVANPKDQEKARFNLKLLIADREARNFSSPLAEGRKDAWQEGTAASALGIVQVDSGAWFYTNRNSVPRIRLPLNEVVAVERIIPGNWNLVITKEGNPGYVDAAAINTSMPDPEAKLYRIQSGDTAIGVVKKFYSGFKYSEDQRYYVNVLVLVNHQAKRPGIKNKTLDAPEGQGKADLAWEASQLIANMQIWIPGQSYAKSLRGMIPTGSISYDTFTAIGDFISDIGEFLLGSVAFIAGLLHGALESLWDLLVGLVDLVKMAYSLIKSIVLGDIINDVGSLWDTLKKIKLSEIFDVASDWLDKKWNAPGTWDRWHFRGWLIGYIIMEIVLLVASDGLITGLKWVGKSAKVAKFVEKIPFLVKVLKRAEELKAAGKLTEVIKGTKVVEELMKARKWAKEALAIPLEILELLTEVTIGRLKKLPAWAMERFKELSSAAMRVVLGCHSPCEVNLERIIEHLTLISKSGKSGKVISSLAEMLAALPKGMNLSLIEEKLTRFPGIVAGIREAGLTADDFKLIEEFLTGADKLRPQTAYETFTRYLTFAVPSKTGKDASKLIKVFDAMMSAEGSSAAARSLKGSIFEAFAVTHLPEFAGKSMKGVEFASEGALKLIKSRTPDFFLEASGELWDFKTSLKYDPKQLEDYIKILNHTEAGLPKVTSINYLFSSKELAEANSKIKKSGALVYYLDNAGKIVVLP